MNNVKKFEETKNALSNFQEQIVYLEQEAQRKLEDEGLRSRAYIQTFLRALQTKELSIDIRKGIVIFQSTTLGNYVQLIWKKKRRINVVPICFLFQLYKENLEVNETLSDTKIDIPFTLRGFWEMKKADKLLNDLILLQIDTSEMIAKQIKLNKKDEKRVKALNKILEVVESLEIFVKNSIYKVNFEQKVFKVNKKNRKLDIVPLCIMLTSYYVRIINYVEDYEKLLKLTEDKEDIYKIEESFKKMMKKYFTTNILPF